MVRRIVAVCVLVGGVVTMAWAQAPAPAAPETAPQKSEVFKLKEEILALSQRIDLLVGQLNVCEAQLAPEVYKAVSSEREKQRLALIAEFEKEHPGWTLDPRMAPVKKSPPAPKKEGGGV